MFHHDRDAIEAHLTVVVAALAVARHLQDATDVTIKKLARTLRPLRTVTIAIGAHTLTAEPLITTDARAILDRPSPINDPGHSTCESHVKPLGLGLVLWFATASDIVRPGSPTVTTLPGPWAFHGVFLGAICRELLR